VARSLASLSRFAFDPGEQRLCQISRRAQSYAEEQLERDGPGFGQFSSGSPRLAAIETCHIHAHDLGSRPVNDSGSLDSLCRADRRAGLHRVQADVVEAQRGRTTSIAGALQIVEPARRAVFMVLLISRELAGIRWASTRVSASVTERRYSAARRFVAKCSIAGGG